MMFFQLSRWRGQGLVEYALLLAFVFLVVVLLVFLFGQGVGDLYSNIIDSV
ncbi:MAG: hypothetical protein Kow00124_32490 [Anaerolineae bacterium]